jgi:hypothetical protein
MPSGDPDAGASALTPGAESKTTDPQEENEADKKGQVSRCPYFEHCLRHAIAVSEFRIFQRKTKRQIQR